MNRDFDHRPWQPGLQHDVLDLRGNRIGRYNSLNGEIRPSLGGPTLRMDTFGIARDPIGNPVGHMNSIGRLIPGLPWQR